MIKTNLSQLVSRLENTKTSDTRFQCFLLVGSEPYLQYQAQKHIQDFLRGQGISQHDTFAIMPNTDWNPIFEYGQTLSLFSEKSVLILHCGETPLSAPITQNLQELIIRLNEDVTLLVVLNKLPKTQETNPWITAINGKTLWVNCHPLDAQYLPAWLNQQARQMRISFDKAASELLCYYYEGNLLALMQLLEQLTLLYPEKKIMRNQIEKGINDCALFSPYHWLDAILAGKTKRTIHILQQLKIKENEPRILLRILQKELFLLVSLKKKTENQTLKLAFDQFNVWQRRRNLLSDALNRLELNTLFGVLQELTEIELSLKRDYDVAVWSALENLSLHLIGKKMNKAF